MTSESNSVPATGQVQDRVSSSGRFDLAAASPGLSRLAATISELFVQFLRNHLILGNGPDRRANASST